MKVELNEALGCVGRFNKNLVFVIEEKEISLGEPLGNLMMWVLTGIRPQEVVGMIPSDIRELCSLLSEMKSKNKNKRTKIKGK